MLSSSFACLGAMELPVSHKPTLSVSTNIFLSPNFPSVIPYSRSNALFPNQKLTIAPPHLYPCPNLSGLRTSAQSTGLGATQVKEGEEVEDSDDTSKKPTELGGAQVEPEADIQVHDGYTITQFCDKMIDLFLNEKPRSKDWKKYLIFREEWMKYRERFYNRCWMRSETESDPALKQKLSNLGRKVKKIDEEMEAHANLLKEIQDSPTDINAIVTRRRKDFTGQFFRYLTLLSETYDSSLEDRDGIARFGARCLSAVSAYDNTLGIIDTFDPAQTKFNDILSSPSLDAACDKIKSLAKTKELDSSLILLINSAWASAKESTTMKNEVKEIMYRLYKTTKSTLRSMAPKEIKLLKYLLNITDPEERFSAMATAFSPGDNLEAKDPDALYSTPKELHKWVKIMLDAYNLNKEEAEIREVKQMSAPIVIQRLFILKETIEEEYLEKGIKTDNDAES